MKAVRRDAQDAFSPRRCQRDDRNSDDVGISSLERFKSETQPLHPFDFMVLWARIFEWAKFMRAFLICMGLMAALVSAPGVARAADDEIVITIKDHRFTPIEVKVPADKRVVITVINDDPTPEEFESKTLKIEKIIPGKSKATIRIGPLKPGRYNFFGEFNEATAQGWVVVD